MHSLEMFIASLAHSLPLELFVVLGSFLEEVIAPIPSPSIMVIAGSFGVVQGYTFSGLASLVLFASIGKTIGGLTMYWIAWKLKDVTLRVFGKFIDLKQEDIDRFGGRFTGTPRDYLVYIFFRSVPVIPSILLSFGSGVLRLPLRLFVVGTFVGTIVRDSFYITVGYKGTGILKTYLESTAQAESVMQYVIIGCLGLFILYLMVRRHRKLSRVNQTKL
jgi:membrane protein DedA with SNARE-associated domain